MARVALDADLVIAFLDPADAQHTKAVASLRPRLTAGDDVLVAASVYAEIMVRPTQRGSADVVDQFLVAIGATVVPMDRPMAKLAAELRARHRSLRLADAFSLATAIASKAELLTLDHGLRRVADRELGS